MPKREGDAAIASLGIHRIPIPIPFPQAGGPVNVVAVEEEGGGIALFDTGLGTSEARETLEAGLADKGFHFRDVRRILITHGHIDHYGLAAEIQDISGAPVRVHARDRAKVVSPVHWISEGPRFTELLLRTGVRLNDAREMLLTASNEAPFARRIEGDVGELAEGEELVFARCKATLLEMPGHTPGLVCAVATPLRGAGPTVLLANDHLLEKVSPNPLLDFNEDGSRFRALIHYFRSLARIREMDFDWIVPGHGPCFQEHRRVIDSLGGFYAKRQERIVSLIPPEGITAMGLVLSLFPKAAPFDTFLMIGEVLGNLDLLEEQGRVGWTEKGGVVRVHLDSR